MPRNHRIAYVSCLADFVLSASARSALPERVISPESDDEHHRVFQKWLEMETERESQSWLPEHARQPGGYSIVQTSASSELIFVFHIDNLAEDPDRFVAFEDIQGFLFPVAHTESILRLLRSYVAFLGIELAPGLRSSNESSFTDPFLMSALPRGLADLFYASLAKTSAQMPIHNSAELISFGRQIPAGLLRFGVDDATRLAYSDFLRLFTFRSWSLQSTRLPD